MVWAAVYSLLLLFIDRQLTTTSNDLSIVVLEFVLLETGIWLAHQLAQQINHAESIMDELAVGAFPHRAQELDEASNRVKIEFTRSRRYHRPLSILLMGVDPEVHKENGQVLKNIQSDIVNRFTSARIGQIIDDRIRQTDLVLRDRQWSYVVICPETDYANVVLLARRIAEAVKEKTDHLTTSPRTIHMKRAFYKRLPELLKDSIVLSPANVFINVVMVDEEDWSVGVGKMTLIERLK